MASSLISPLLTGQFTPTGQNRFTSTSTSLSENGILLDFSFIVPENYDGSWDFLKDFFLTVSYRIGIGNGSAIQLISSCSVYSLLALSDYLAGVSMESTKFEAGKKARISGYVDTGYFEMRSNDALEVTLIYGGSASSRPAFNIDFTISNVFTQTLLVMLKTYQSCNPTGADQPYKNVLAVYYDSHTPTEKDAVIKDQLGNTHAVSVPSAIAYSNSVGRFEFFTDFGELYKEPFQVSQDVTIKVPQNTSEGADVAEILIVGLAFYPELLLANASVSDSVRDSLLANIKESDGEKYKYLEYLGLGLDN